MERKLTSGSVAKSMLVFALPYLLSYFLQTLYGMADLFITGQFYGVDHITAVSNGSQIMHMITVIIVGLAMGTTVIVGRYVGGNRMEDAEETIGNTVTMFLVLSILTTGVLLLLRQPIVYLLGTPQEAIAGSIAYLTITFLGIPFITVYNIISSIYRGLGDSKTPMYFIGIACAFNIVLDYVFIGYLHLGASGAALGTTISQTFSVVLAILCIRKKKSGISLRKSHFVPKRQVLGRILKSGVPVAVQDGCIQIAFIIITIIANHRGLHDAAAVGIVEKIITAIFIVPSSMLATISTLSAQNIGANKHDRVAKILRLGTMITAGYGVLATVIVLCWGNQIIGLFTADASVILLGTQYISSYIFDSILAGIHFCFTGYFCAYGKSYIGFIHNILAIALVRLPVSYLFSAWYPDTLFPMGLAAPAGSLLSVMICVIVYFGMKKRGSLGTIKA